MNKQLIFIPGLIVFGILAGIFIMKSQQGDVVTTPTADKTPDVQNTQPQPDTVLQSLEAQRLNQIEAKLTDLQTRMELLENIDLQISRADLPHKQSIEFSSVADTAITSRTRVLDIDNLVKAGIDAATAADIVRRKNELELGKLELRDKASRENYLSTRKYMDELNALVETDINLREEIGDDAYDQYLYASGQANRVRIASVMIGSAAEQAGMENGDLIISYGEQRLFSWGQLQKATTEGERNEYVNVTVVRNGTESILWLPRGPLGVRLTSTRVNPDI